jgi:hypothetical protein
MKLSLKEKELLFEALVRLGAPALHVFATRRAELYPTVREWRFCMWCGIKFRSALGVWCYEGEEGSRAIRDKFVPCRKLIS